MDIKDKKILIVDDDLYLADIYSQFFTKKGFFVVSAYDGEEALDKASSEEFYFILLDIMLPKKRGIEVLKEIREGSSPSKNTPIFMLTTLGYDDIIKEAFSLGASGYIVKSTLSLDQIYDEIDSFFTGEKIITD
ncbi:response regulator [Patescibacteria group bacterium]|nr:response regulator [Patescibacteria group bacterium]